MRIRNGTGWEPRRASRKRNGQEFTNNYQDGTACSNLIPFTTRLSRPVPFEMGLYSKTSKYNMEIFNVRDGTGIFSAEDT